MKTVIAQDAAAAAAHAAEALHHALLQSHTHAILLLLSGGSALALLQRAPKDVVWENVTIGVVDERYRADKDDRNDIAVRTAILTKHACASGAHFVSIAHSAPTRTDAARRYEEVLHTWHNIHKDGVVVALLGIGPDGHTAGIMPFPEDPQMFAQLFDNPQRDVVGYDATGKNPFPERVTLTMTYLRARVNHAIVYACGIQKRTALSRVLAPDGTLAQTPARIMREMRDVHLFTDIHLTLSHK